MENEILKRIQDYALEEHLHRSLKDSIITLFYKLTEGIESLLNINKMITLTELLNI